MKLLCLLSGRRKVMAIILSLSVLVTLLVPATSVFAANATSATLSITDAITTHGTSFDVYIKITTNGDTRGWEINQITFDPSKLQCNSVVLGTTYYAGASSFGSKAIDNTAGTIVQLDQTLTSTVQGAITDGIIATINFTALGDATYDSIHIVPDAINTWVQDSNAQIITNCILIDGTVAIGSVPPPTTISSFSPSSGVIGTEITITGTSFVGTPTVTIGGIAATDVSVVSVTEITCKVGAGADGKVKVTTTINSAYSANDFDYLPPSNITFSPAAALNGATVHVYGDNLSGAISVTLGGTAATIVSNTNTQIDVTVNGGSSGPVTVTTPGGSASSSTSFGYLVPATITGISPDTAGQGASVVISGTNFVSLTGTSAVQFGTIDAASYSVNSNFTQITAVVPDLGPSAATFNITVTTAAGPVTLENAFHYVLASINTVNPTSAFYGDTVVISGSGFSGVTGASAVKFGGIDALSYTVNSYYTQITAVVGAGASGNVEVVTGSGTLTKEGFIYKQISVAPAQVTSGDTFDVNLNINASGKAIRVWQADVAFDPNKLACVGISEGSFLKAYTRTASVLFTASSGSGAKAFATINDAGGIASVTVTAQGSGYTSAPDVTISSVFGGSGATATATLSSGKVTAVTVTNPGSGYVGTTAAVSSPVINNNTGHITGLGYAIMGGSGGPSGQDCLAVLHFIVKSSATTPYTDTISLSNLIMGDINSDEIHDILVSTGAVTFSAPQADSNDNEVPIDAGLGSQLTFIAPASVTGWNLVVSANNNVQRTMNVFANTGWQVSVSDNNAITGGYMAKYDGSAYTSPVIKLANPLYVNASAGNGAGYQANLSNGLRLLATGEAAGQDINNGGDIREIMFDQRVIYTDPTVSSPYSLHLVVTFTASNNSY